MKLYEILRCSDKHKPMLSFPSVREGLILDSDKWDQYFGHHKEHDANKRYYISRVEFYPEFDGDGVGEVVLEFSPAEDTTCVLPELHTAIKEAICRCIESGDFKPKWLIRQISVIELFFKNKNHIYTREKYDLYMFDTLYSFLHTYKSRKKRPTCDDVRSLSVSIESIDCQSGFKK